MIILYGGDKEMVESQISCEHTWSYLSADDISAFQQCTKCFIIKRFGVSISAYCNTVEEMHRNKYIPPGMFPSYNLGIGVLIHYRKFDDEYDEKLSKMDALKKIFCARGITVTKRSLSEEPLLTTGCNRCGTTYAYRDINCIPLETYICPCGETYMICYMPIKEYQDDSR